jgi:translation initiation factor 3 subunit A
MLIVELISNSSGSGEKEKKAGLEQLHNIVSNSRKRNNAKVYDEAFMKRHLELCVDLKDHRTAKDGLHQYRNMVLNVSLRLYFILIGY